ncbi:MAG: Mur ligase family protein [Candidatus Babeliales bacterium]
MKNVNTHKQAAVKNAAHGQQRSYNELVEYLDVNWSTNKNDNTLSCIKKLDQAFGNISQKLNTILITGSNGKSLTAHFTTKLLREEGLTVGTFYSPHFLTYNERFSCNDDVILNKTFTDLANEVINTATAIKISPNSIDVLTMMALLYFEKNKTDVVVLEVSDSKTSNAVTICKPKIVAVTRVTEPEVEKNPKEVIENVLAFVQDGTHVVSADQSKANLQIMQDITTQKGGEWSMPIRKLAQLSYPFEQLHGRCAALAERISFVYINTFANQDAMVVNNSLLTKQKGQRGRPTLEAKRQSELNPKRTTEQFWKETCSMLPGRFQLLDKEKPTILLDNAATIDAFKNVLLGTRLLHYQRPLKGLTVILGCNNNTIDISEFLKLLRYFFKKTSGQVIVCPVEPLPGHQGEHAWDVEKVTNDIKSMKIKAKSAKNFKEAFETAQKTVDTRYGLVVITGSSSVVTEYWKYKGIKKL